jgi:hypothetical protein
MRKIRIAGNSTVTISPFSSVWIGGEKSVDGQTQTLPAVIGLSHSLAQKRYVLSQQGSVRNQILKQSEFLPRSPGQKPQHRSPGFCFILSLVSDKEFKTVIGEACALRARVSNNGSGGVNNAGVRFHWANPPVQWWNGADPSVHRYFR